MTQEPLMLNMLAVIKVITMYKNSKLLTKNNKNLRAVSASRAIFSA